MNRRRLFWQILPSFLVVLLAAIGFTTLNARSQLRTFYVNQVRASLETQARLLAVPVMDRLSHGSHTELDALCKDMGDRAGVRVTVVLDDGTVIADSNRDPATMDNHADRPEVGKARKGGVGTELRYSHTLQQQMMYVAVPLPGGTGEAKAVIRTSYSLQGLYKPIDPTMGRLLLGGLAVALVAIAASFVMSRRITRPLEIMTEVASGYAAGDFDRRVPRGGSTELGQLADALNRMAARVQDQLTTIREQRNEADAVLASMLEGVIAVDPEERIINMNDAAIALMGVKQSGPLRNRPIQEVLRNADLQAFVKKVLAGPDPAEADIVIHDREMKYLQAHGTVLAGPEGEVIGALVVLNNVTRLRHLENVRRDFVANVSHELKTPITTIKGFVETLLDGALDEPENARKFLGIVATHADRLTAIIEDLLSLSRLEQERESGSIDVAEHDVRGILQNAVDTCTAGASARNVTVEMACRDQLTLPVNAALVEQAVINLVDNAVKYSDVGAHVKVTAEQRGGEIAIAVTDQGCGIDAADVPRLFERFYRVDKARSRELGGTGLGLAIVKHIAQTHKGRVEVSSEVGKGSVFTIYLPVSRSRNGVQA